MILEYLLFIWFSFFSPGAGQHELDVYLEALGYAYPIDSVAAFSERLHHIVLIMEQHNNFPHVSQLISLFYKLYTNSLVNYLFISDLSTPGSSPPAFAC